MRHRWLPLCALAALVLGCGPSGSAPSEQPGGSSSQVSVPSPSGGAPTQQKKAPAIRDSTTVGAFSSGAALEVRAFVSRQTVQDPILLAIRLRPEKPIEEGHPWLEESLDLKDVVPKLKLEVEGPSGKHELVVADPPSRSAVWKLSDLRVPIAIDGASLTLRQGTGLQGKADAMVWKTPQPDLLSKPGKYTVTISGEIKTSAQTLTLASKPIEIEVVEASPSQRTLAELETEAIKIANNGAAPGPLGPSPNGLPVEDVDGNRSFELRGQAPGYDVPMFEVVLDPAGKEVARLAYEHFTCVAAGTSIETPAGPVPIESIRVGQEVSAFDVEAGAPATATVQQIRTAPAERLVRFGDLRVTGSHPLFADGAWRRADDVAPGASLMRLDGSFEGAVPTIEAAQTTVFDISVSAPNTYFAGGVLVHNKAVGVPLHGGAPWGGWFSRLTAAK